MPLRQILPLLYVLSYKWFSSSLVSGMIICHIIIHSLVTFIHKVLCTPYFKDSYGYKASNNYLWKLVQSGIQLLFLFFAGLLFMPLGRRFGLQEVNVKLWLLFWIFMRSMLKMVVVKKSRMRFSFKPVLEVSLYIIFKHIWICGLICCDLVDCLTITTHWF